MTRSDRKRHVDAWLSGKISREDYCAKHGISLGTFRSWVANYAYLSGQPRLEGEASKQLVPVRLVESSPSEVVTAMELRTPSGYVLSMGSGQGPEWVAELVRRLG
jgi:hypothetical protein